MLVSSGALGLLFTRMQQQSRRMLLEDSFGTFQPDRKRIVFESTPSGRQFARIPGRLSLCDTVNGNNRRYRRSVWEKNLKEDSLLQSAIKRNAAFGLLEHPADGHVGLQSPLAVLVTKANLTEDSGIPVVDGEILVLGTPEGQRLSALIEAGWDPTVSSRGYGSLAKGADGIDEVQDDYVCEGWDVVLKPSFTKAILTPNRTQPTGESRLASVAPVAALTEGTPAPTPASLLKESTPAPSAPTKTTATNETSKTMIQDIRARLAALKGVDVTKLTPNQYAEGITEMQALHQQAATYLAEDVRRSWDVDKLHKEISTLEEAWNAAAVKPAATATKLAEDNSKLLKVTSAVVNAAVATKKMLGEKVTQLTNIQTLLEQTITRGKYWKRQAEALQAKLELSEARLDFSCRGLERIAERYKTDMTAVSKRLVEVEFKDKIAESKEVQDLLAKASKPFHIIAIREKLTGKKAAAPAAPAGTPTPVTENKDKDKETPAPVTETAKETPPPAPAKPASSSPLRKAAPQPKVLSQPETGPQQISESVAVAQRLSRAATMA